jgi:hypothetical protein
MRNFMMFLILTVISFINTGSAIFLGTHSTIFQNDGTGIPVILDFFILLIRDLIFLSPFIIAFFLKHHMRWTILLILILVPTVFGAFLGMVGYLSGATYIQLVNSDSFIIANLLILVITWCFSMVVLFLTRNTPLGKWSLTTRFMKRLILVIGFLLMALILTVAYLYMNQAPRSTAAAPQATPETVDTAKELLKNNPITEPVAPKPEVMNDVEEQMDTSKAPQQQEAEANEFENSDEAPQEELPADACEKEPWLCEQHD